VTQADLEGKIWVADLIFTRCGSICPILSANMARLQTALRKRGGEMPVLVSFTVDPAADTPPVLSEYASRFHADPEHWLFLTGERAALYELIGEGFHLGVAQREEGGVTDPNQLITHSDRFILIDRALRIRGYYRGIEASAVPSVLRDIDRLRSEE
jgi:protein SCO1/2